MNESARVALIRARTALYIDQPMYGILSLRLKMVENVAIKRLCVSHKEIQYNPDYVLKLTDLTRVSAIAHEVSHVMMHHLNRCAGRNPKKWNAAGDYVINAQLKTDKFTLDPSWLYSPMYAGKSADEVYSLLPDGQDDGQDEQDPSDPEDVDGAAEDELAWKVATISAAKEAQKQGKLPESLKRLMDELTDNKVDWREKLRRFATAHAKNDYSWARPQRRMLPFGLYLPSLYSEAMGVLVTAIDTSGSISRPILDAFGAEVIAARNATSPEKLVNIYCDDKVRHVDTYDQFEPVTFEGHGGGGTSFLPPFKHVDQNAIKPACLIYLTDGYGPFPSVPPPYPVLWCMTTDVIAPWGETVRIEV